MTEPPASPDLMQAGRDLHDAVADILGRQGLMVTKWLLSAEVLDSDGNRDLHTFTSPDFRAWDSLGFLGFLHAREQGVVGAEAAREREPDGDPDGE